MRYVDYQDDDALHERVMQHAIAPYFKQKKIKIKHVIAASNSGRIYLVCADHHHCSAIKLQTRTKKRNLAFVMSLHRQVARAGLAAAIKHWFTFGTHALIHMANVDGSCKDWLATPRPTASLRRLVAWIKDTVQTLHSGQLGSIITHGDMHLGNICFFYTHPPRNKREARAFHRSHSIAPCLIDFEWGSRNTIPFLFHHIDVLQVVRTILWWVPPPNQTVLLDELIPYLVAVQAKRGPTWAAECADALQSRATDTFEAYYQTQYGVYKQYCKHTRQGIYR